MKVTFRELSLYPTGLVEFTAGTRSKPEPNMAVTWSFSRTATPVREAPKGMVCAGTALAETCLMGKEILFGKQRSPFEYVYRALT
jgi:hypothetical protein